jgi:RHS repeat-associated protein
MDIFNPVLTPNNEFSGVFTVTGKDGQLVRPSFELMMGNAAYVNEVGIYKVDDDLGTINGVKPGDQNYAKLALSGINSHALLGNFQSMGFAMEDLVLKSGDRVGFYLASNTTADSVVMHNPQNINGNQYRAFFSAVAANPDGIDYVQEKVVDGKLQLWWEDIAGGGDRDYDDMVVRVGTSQLDAQNWTPKGNQVFQLAGEIDESVTFKFSMLGSAASYHDEIGLFLVDDAVGSIGNLRPSDEGYKLAALQRGQVLFNSFSTGNVQEITLSGGAFVGLYIVQNGNSDQVLSGGDRQPDVYLSFLEANGGYDYISRMGNHFYFEDMRGLGDRDYNDMVMRMDWVRNTQTPMSPPTINFNLLKDTGISDSDRLTSDVRIVGNVKTTDSGNFYTRLEAKLIDSGNNTTEATEYIDISEFLKNDGSFTLQKDNLSRIFGKNLVDGSYRLQMRVTKELLTPVINNIGNNSGIFVVNDSSGQPINPYFYLSQVNSTYKNEIGLFKVDDDLGTIDGIAPSDPRYLQIALDPSRRKTIFADSANAALITNSIGLQNGDRIAFYLVADAKADEVLTKNPKNERSSAGNVFFSIASANPELDVHLRSQFVDGKLKLSWEDMWGGGDRDFDDVVLKVGRDNHTFLMSLPENPLSAESVLDFVYDSQIALNIVLDPSSAISLEQPNKTNKALVTLVGKSDAGANVSLPALSLVAIADSSGAYKFENVTLKVGNNSFAVTASDAAGNSNVSSLVIERISLSIAAPTALNLSNNVTPENVAIGSVIGNFSSVDPDAGDTHTYSLAAGTGDADNASFEIINNELKWKESPNFEVKNAYSIRVRTTDAGGLTFEQVFSINVLNINEAPKFTSTPVISAGAGLVYTYNIATSDPENSDRLITGTNIPTWLTLTNNGNGTATLTGTPQFNDAGLYNIQLKVKESSTAEKFEAFQNLIIGVDSLLTENSNFNPERVMNFITPVEPSLIQFKIKNLSFDSTDKVRINDAFEVALLDAGGNNALVHTIANGQDAFINFTEGEIVKFATGVTYDNATGLVTLNIVGIAPNTPVQLVFRLVNNDTDTASQVEVTNISITPAPIGTLPPVQSKFALRTAAIAAPNPISFLSLADVTTSIQANYARTNFTEGGKVLTAEVNLENIGTYALNDQLVLAVKNISSPSIVLRNADGVTPDGYAYIDFSKFLQNGNLDPTQKTNLGELIFYNPDQIQFTYELVVLAKINNAPEIITNPLLPGRNVAEVVGGNAYSYDVNATDKDSDPLAYRLLVAPEGMTINANSGLIAWNTTTANVGNQSIVVEVADGRGGTDTQSYTLSVIGTPPNRPPIFTTDPVVDAYINQLYTYDANAIDPDLDDVSFNLIIGPNGMTVNRDTGLVQWTPPAALVIGDTVLGRISIPGENDEFSFSGVAGQKIYYDSLNYTGAADKWNFKIVTPSGRQVLSTNFAWDSWGLITLDETGNYRVVVDAVNDQTGNYGFRLTDPSLVPVIQFDQVISDRLSPGNQDRLYRFTAAKDQRLFLDALSRSSATVDWYVINPQDQYIHYTDFSDIEMVMPQDGEYILVARGRAGFINSVDYTFSLVNSDVITRSMNVSEVVEGAIAKKGGQHTYTFNGTSGQQVFFDSLDGNAYLPYTLHDPFGNVVINRADNRGDRAFIDGFTFVYDGTYKLMFDGDGETIGKYKFRLLDKVSAAAYTSDTDLTGAVDNAASGAKLFKFTIQENLANPDKRQYVYLDGLNATPQWWQTQPGAWILYNSQGQQLNSTRLWDDREMWLGAGDYILVMQGYNGYYYGDDPNYTFRVITSDTPITDITSKIYTNPTNGQVIEGSIAEKGNIDTYTFTGTAGQQLFFDSLANSVYFTYDLIDPQGTVLVDNADIRGDRYFLDGFTLPTGGQYKIVIDGSAETTGAYKFRLLDKSSAAPLALDTVLDSTSENSGYNTDFYELNITTRQYLYVDATSYGYNGSAWWLTQPGDWVLYNEVGTVLQNNIRLWEDREFWLDPGKYTLAVRGYGSGYEPRYNLSVTTPDLVSTPLTLGNTVTGSIVEKGEQDTYTFTATSGEQLFFDSLDGNAALNYYLYSPQGTVLVNNADIRSDRYFVDGLTLVTNGEYKLVVDGSGENTGDYKFRLLGKSNATLANLDTDISGNFTNTLTSAERFKFTLSSRQYLYFDALPPAGSYTPSTYWLPQTTEWKLYSANGVEITTKRLWEDYETWLDAGEYTLVMRGYGSGYLSDYNLRIVTPDLNTTPLTLGTVVTGAIAEKGEQDYYTFNGNAGQSLYLDLINRGNSQTTKVILTDEYGREVLNRWVSDNDPDAFILTHSGIYKLIFDGNGESTDTYSFSLVDLSTATDITGNIGKGGAISNTIYNGHAYKLSNATYWTNAQAEAQAIGANLVTINDAAEQTFINTNFDANAQYYYIGLTDQAQEGQWKWISGETAPYTNWYPGEPNGGTGENYALMYSSNRWIDISNQGYRGLIEQNDITVTLAPTSSTDTLTDGRSAKFYQFTGTKGQGLIFNPTTIPANTNWTLYGASGEVLMNAAANTSQFVSLKADGIYTLAIRGNNAASANYAFEISELKAGTPATPTGTAINFNQIYSGNLNNGEVATFTFNGTSGQSLFYDAQGGSAFTRYLYDPSGKQVLTYNNQAGYASNGDFGSEPQYGQTLGIAGTYTMTIVANGTGSYTFQLLDLASASNIPVDIDTVGTFASGATEADAFKLDVATRTYYHIDGKEGDGYIYVYGDNGNSVTYIRTYQDTQFWLDPGQYYFVFAGAASNASYRAQLVQSEVTDLGNIGFNTEVSGTITKKLTHYSYNFTGKTGQLVMFDALPSDANMRVRILDPNGRMLNQDDPSYYYGGGQSLNSDRLPESGLTLSMDGVYTLQVVSYGGIYGTAGTGNYKFRLLDLNSASTINLDSTISGTLDHDGSGAVVYRFNNPTRQYLFVDGQGGDGDWIIYRADGTRVDSNYISYNAQFWLDAGDYYLAITARGSNPNYQMKIVTPALVTFPEINFSNGVSDVVSDTIDEKGEQHYYSFQGRAGEKIYFDSLGSDTYFLNYTVYDKNYRVLATEYYGGIYSDRDYGPDSTPYYSPTRGFTLLEDGAYYIHVDGYDDRGGSEYTGNYRFRLLDLENAPEVNLDELIAGTWDYSSLGAKSYKFTNPQQQYIYVDGQEGNGDWNIYRADGTRVDGNYVAYNAEFWLDAGEYYLVVSGRSGGTNYKLQLVTPELKTVTTPVAFDTVISDVIDEKGEQHYYTFDGKAGQRIMFDALNTPGLLYTRITDPLGRLITDETSGRGIQSNADRFPDQGLTLAFDGTYHITIDGYDDRGTSEYTGNYRFQLVDLDAKPNANFDVTLDGAFLIGDNGKLGGTGYTFTVDRPQYFFFDGQGGSAADAGWALYRPNGIYVTGGKTWEDRETWLDPGEYSLVVYGITPVNTGREKTVLNPVNNHYYSLLSGAGSWEALQSKAEALGGNLVTINDAAENQFLIDNLGGDYYIGFTDKEQDGVWKWISGEAVTYTNWNGGEPNGGTGENYGYIYGFGKWNDIGNAGYRGVVESEIDPSTIIVQSTYKIQIATPDLISQSYVIGNVVSDAIAIKGDQRYYTFEGKAGQRLYLDSQTKTAGFKIRITDPVGRNITGDFDTASADDRDNIILSETGTYTLTVDPTGEATGEYRFKLMEYGDRATMPTPITLNLANPSVTVTGTYDDTNKREADFYRFTSSGKQNIFVDAITGDGNNYWGIYKPNGENLVWGRLYEDKDVYLDAAGQYTLVMWGGGVANNSYEVSLNLTGDQTTAYTLGNTTNSNLSVKGENDIYTFAGNAGQMLFFDALIGNTDIKARLYSPSGALISDRDTNADWSPLLLGENGEYRLVIDGLGATIGNYSFALNDRTATTAIALDTTTTAQLNPGNQLDLYRINGITGKLLKFDLAASTWVGANWVLYDPSGVAISAPATSSPDFSLALGATGTYTLAIAGTSANPVDYSFTVTDLTPAAVTKSGFNTIYSGSFDTANEVDEFTFNANAGTVLWYDSLGTTSEWRARMRLLNPDGTAIVGDSEARYDQGSFTLQQTGIYKVQLRDYYSQAYGSYKFQLLELPKNFGFGVNYLELGQPISGTSTEGAAKVYTFQALQGMQVMFNGMYGTGVTAWLYDSNGNLVTSIGDFRNNDNGLTTLKRSDIYNLVIGGNSGQNNAYSFQLLDNITSPKIEYNLNVNRSETSSQNSFLYRIHAEKGQTLYFDNLAFNANGSSYPNYYRWQLFSPSGTRITDQEMRYDFETKIAETGEYVLQMQGIWEAQPYNYLFRVFSLDPKDTNALDVITPGTSGGGDAGDGSLGRFAVTIQAQDEKGATADQSYTIKLWPQPDNSNPIIISAPDTRHSLKEKGYRYQINAIDPDGDALAYRLVDSPNGALINQDTGELLWFPEASIINGSKVNFTVEVADRKGGFDRQTFTVEVFSNLGKIQGLVFDDLNGNGLRDSKLIKGDNPAIVIAIDVSGSTEAPFYGKGEYENVKTVLDAQRTAALLLIDSIIAQGAGNKIKIGIIPHEFNATIQDMDSSLAGLQEYTTALADNNNNGILDVVEILNSYVPNGNNRFIEALKQMEVLVQGYSGTPNLLFMSDGYSHDKLEDLGVEGSKLRNIINGQGGNVTSFAIGEASALDTMQAIDPDAIRLTDIEELALIFSGFDERYAIEPLKDGVLMYIDSNNNGSYDVGEPSDITDVNVEPNAFGQVTRYQYEFTDLLPGDYVVRPIVTSGYKVTTPATGFTTNSVTLAGETITNSFGIHKITEPVNIAPEFKTQPQDLYKIKSGELLKYTATAIDLNSDAISFDLLLAPDGMTVDKETGTVVWLPTVQQVENYYSELREKLASLDASRQQTDVITFQVLLRAQDGKGGKAIQAINIELVPDNTAPVITSVAPDSTKPQVGKQFQYQVKAQDVDTNPITFSLVDGAPAGVAIDATGLVTWTPVAGQVGKQQFTIKAADNKGGSTLQTVMVSVINAIPNQSPVIVSQPRDRLRLGSNYFYQIEATDADGDALTYSLDVKPAGMTIQQNTIVWTPAANQSGNQNVVVKVTDSQGGSTTQSFQITVAHQAANNTPTITSAPNTFVANLDRQYEYQLTGNDPDGDPFFWTLDNAPEGMVIDNQTGLLRWNPKQTQLGEHTVSIRITDLNGAYSGQEFTVKVTGANTPPLIISTPNTQGSVGQGYAYTAVAKDAENDAIIYSLARRPSGMEIDPSTGEISWTPSFTGSYEIQVQARDSQGANSLQTYTIVVGTVAVNKSPTITSTPVFLADTANIYKYQVTATDPDVGDTLTYELISAPSGVAIDPISGLLSWNSPIVGTYKVVVGVNDGNLGAAQGFTLTARANQLPTIASTNPPTGAIPGVQYVYDAIARDPDGGKLTYAIDVSSKAKGMTIDELGRLRWTPTNAQSGVNNVTITITDEAGATINQTFSINVQPDTTAPTVKLGFAGFNPAEVGSRVLFQVQATDNARIDNLELTVGGKAVILDQFGQAGFTLDTAGTITAIAKATDAAGNVKTETFTIDVFDSSVPQKAPEVRLDLNLIPDGIISKVTALRGLVDDPDDNLSRYRLEVAPLNTENWSTMFEVLGTEVASGGVLGKFDPTAIDDGIYRVKLTAWDTTDISSSIENQIEVFSGDLKFGEFQLSFTDISISAGNIPVQLVRTYDTLKLNANSAEMAPGWRVEFRDVDLRTSLGAPDPFYEEQGLTDRSRGHKVGDKIYITIGGKREVFELALKPAVREGYTLSLYGITLYDPIYKPVGNTKSKLTLTNYQTANITLIDTRPDDILSNLAAVPYDLGNSYFNTKYLLTTEEGIQYEIDPVNGKIDRVGKDLYNIDFSGRVKANANPTEFLEMTDSYIKSSYGAKIDFERDSKGRIVAAVDQDGNKVLYSYDKNGDLVSFTDREGNVTKFEYNSTRKHYLDKVIDPLNRSVIRNEYDALGRLTKVFDAAGNAINMTFNPENQIQVVTNPLGYSTTYEYDDRGNTVQEVYADGGIVKKQYDSRGNVTSLTDQLGYTTKFYYDSTGKLTKESDALGNIATYTFSNGYLQSITDELGNITTIKTDDQKQTLTTINAKGTESIITPTSLMINGVSLVSNITEDALGRYSSVNSQGINYKYTYDNSGRLLTDTHTVTTAGGSKDATTTYEYDKNGNITTIQDEFGRTTQFEYDKVNQLIAITDYLGTKTTATYDSVGNLVRVDYTDGTTKEYTYDAMQRNTSEKSRDGSLTKYEYDSMDRLTKTIYSDGTFDASEYDLLGQVTAIFNSYGERTEYTYDAVGNRVKVKSPEGKEVNFSYDAAGRNITVTDDQGKTLYIEYDAEGLPVKFTLPDGSVTQSNTVNQKYRLDIDENGNSTIYELNVSGLVSAVIDAEGRRTSYTYDEVGNLLSQTNANGAITKYEYDVIGRRTAKILPDGSRQEFSYDSDGNPSLKDFDGQITSAVVSTTNNQVVQTLPDSTQRILTYNSDGLLVEYRSGSATASYTYDSNRQTTNVRDVNGKNVSYTYDSSGKVTKIISDFQTTEYEYDLNDRVVKISDSLNGNTVYVYDNNNNLVERQYANGVLEKSTYASNGFLTKIEQFDSSSQLIFSQSYTRDLSGQVTKVSENTGKEVSYTYDKTYRLISENIIDPIEGTRNIAYTYDASGNRISRNDSILGFTTYTYGDNDKLLSEITGSLATTYTYDFKGNLISETNTNQKKFFTWNSLNKLTKIEIQDVNETVTYEVSYQYDLNGNLISQVENGVQTFFLLDYAQPNPQVMAEYNSDGSLVKAYTYGDHPGPIAQSDRNGKSLYYLTDRMGSTRLVVDESGNDVGSYDYDAYGRIIKQSGTVDVEYLYNGEMYNFETGLQYLRARYLDVSTGRFISRDPFEGYVTNPISQNSYQYADLNPVNNSDPSGNFSIAEFSVASVFKNILEGIGNANKVIQGKTWIDRARAIDDLVSMLIIGGFIYGSYEFGYKSLANPHSTYSTLKINYFVSLKLKGTNRVGNLDEIEGEVSVGHPAFNKNGQFDPRTTIKVKGKWKNGFKPGIDTFFEGAVTWGAGKGVTFNLGGGASYKFIEVPDTGSFGPFSIKGSVFKLELEARAGVIATGWLPSGTYAGSRIDITLKTTFLSFLKFNVPLAGASIVGGTSGFFNANIFAPFWLGA